MTREAIREIAEEIQQTKHSKRITKRELVNALGCEKRTKWNVVHIDDFLKKYDLETYPSYAYGHIDEEIELRYKYPNLPGHFKLYSLSVDKYKNIEKLSVNFANTTNYCAFIGINGSGKSNLLELVSAIFYSLYHFAILKDAKRYKCDFSYSISYTLNGNLHQIKDGKLISGEKVTLEILPRNIIASYSGEDTRLWEKYYKPIYERFCSSLTQDQGFTPPFMFYLNKEHWGIALLVLLYSNDVDILDFTNSLIDGRDCSISFQFTNSHSHKWTGSITEIFIDELKSKEKYTIEEFKDKINDISFIDQPSTLFYYLYRSSTNKESQLLIDVDIIFGDGANLRGLSEGEKRLILTNLIIHILANQASLCLFDEPDSHIHTSRKIDLLNLLSTNNRYSVLTTHSAIFLEKMNADNIKYIHRGKVKDGDKLKQIKELSGGQINYIDGALLLSSKNIIVTEGTYDIKYIKHAISVLSQSTPDYLRLNKIAFIPQGSADHTKSFFDDIIQSQLPNINKVVYIFDYDKPGINAWSVINSLKSTYEQLDTMFYQTNYDIAKDNSVKNPIKDTCFVEDLFCKSCYNSILEDLHSRVLFHELKELQGGTAKKIKDKIEKEYLSFSIDKYDGFRPLLDKLLKIFPIL